MTDAEITLLRQLAVPVVRNGREQKRARRVRWDRVDTAVAWSLIREGFAHRMAWWPHGRLQPRAKVDVVHITKAGRAFLASVEGA